MQIPEKIVFSVLLTVFALAPTRVWADTREQQVQIEPKIVEVSNTENRHFGVDLPHDTDLARTRSLERLGQPADVPQNQNVFDFKPLNPAPQEPGIQKIAPDPAGTPAAEVQNEVELVTTPRVSPASSGGKVELAVNPRISKILTPVGYERSRKENERVPLLAKIPVLGHLFRRHGHAPEEKSAEKKDLLVFVTPTLVQPDPDGSN